MEELQWQKLSKETDGHRVHEYKMKSLLQMELAGVDIFMTDESAVGEIDHKMSQVTHKAAKLKWQLVEMKHLQAQYVLKMLKVYLKTLFGIQSVQYKVI